MNQFIKKFVTLVIFATVPFFTFAGDLVPVLDKNGNVVAYVESGNTNRSHRAAKNNRCGPNGYLRQAVIGGVVGALLSGDKNKGARRGAGAMIGLRAVDCELGGTGSSNGYYRNSHYGNPGVQGYRLRGIGDNLIRDQRQAERDAYRFVRRY